MYKYNFSFVVSLSLELFFCYFPLPREKYKGDKYTNVQFVYSD